MDAIEKLQVVVSQLNMKKSRGGLRANGYYKESQADRPLISIITVVYNGEEFLEQALVSVINQDYNNIEFVVIDGGSTDSSVDIIRKYESCIDYWESELDEGQSDAFIKAINVCEGEWLTWLNGDDILLPGAITELVNSARKYPDVECFTGNVIWTTADNTIIQCRKGERWTNAMPMLGRLNVYGPTTFFKQELYEKVDGINKNLHYMMDTDLWWQFYMAGAKFRRLKQYTWTLRLHENAKMSGHNFEHSPQSNLSHTSWNEKRKETNYIIRKYKVPTSRIVKIFGTIYMFLNRLKSWRYLLSLFHTIKYSGRDIKELYPGIK